MKKHQACLEWWWTELDDFVAVGTGGGCVTVLLLDP